MSNKILKIEQHLFENKNHTVRTEYRVWREGYKGAYNTKTSLTPAERNFFIEQGEVKYHF